MSCSGCGSGSTPSGCGNNGYCASGGCSKLEVYDWLSDITYDSFTKYDTFEISFKNGSRKGFYKLDKPLDIVTGDFVIVESSVGYDLGKVSLSGELVNLQMRKKRTCSNYGDDEEENFNNDKLFPFMSLPPVFNPVTILT